MAEAKTEELQIKYPEISVLGPGQKQNVLDAIFNQAPTRVRENERAKNLKIRTPSHKTISLNDEMPSEISGPASLIGNFKLRSRFHLRVQEGCENHCTFCIIPQTRGELSSRPIKDILKDLRQLKEKGYQEVVLTGTHLGGYGVDIGENLLTLLNALENESELRRIRLSSLDPNDVSFEIIDFISKSHIFCRHLHICLQAFTDQSLKRMNRKYRMEDAKALLWYIAERFSGCGIGSDVITGFPGESRKELEEGIEEFLTLPISYLHVFPYSEREGTAATRLDQIVAIAERKRRAARWRSIAERKHNQFLLSLIGKDLDVVIEDRFLEDGSVLGTSSEFANVRILNLKNVNNNFALKCWVPSYSKSNKNRGRRTFNMRIIKPGKLGGISSLPKIKRVEPESNRREVWDDFSPNKNTPKVVTKKKEYARGVGDRMIPKSTLSKYDTVENQDSENKGPAVELERYEPRADLETLEASLAYTFVDKSYLSMALTHRSALGFKERADYERLEFLGDAVLDLSVAHLLSDLHPEAREGELSKMRAALVNTQALAQIAKGLGMGPYVKLGRGEFSAGGAERPSILADVMEAVIGGVYRDSCYEVALSLVERIFGAALKEVTPI